MRLLVILALIYLAYRAFKSWFSKNIDATRPVDGPDRHSSVDVMLKDPVCGIYFPKNEGVPLRIDGQEHLFCSEKCRDSFIEMREQDSGEG